MGSIGGVPYMAVTGGELRDKVVDAAVAFVDACFVYGDDGQFQVQTHMAKDETERLFNLVWLWKTIGTLSTEEDDDDA